MKKVTCLFFFISGLALNAQNGLPTPQLVGGTPISSKSIVVEGSKTDHDLPADISNSEWKEEKRKESAPANNNATDKNTQATPVTNSSSEKKSKKTSPNTP